MIYQKFRLKFSHKYNLLIKSVFKKQVNLVKNKKTFLEKHLDVFVSRFTWVRNLTQSQELIKYGFILVNRKSIKFKNFQLKETDIVSTDDYYLKVVKFCFKSWRKGFPQTQNRHLSNKILSEKLVQNSIQKDIFF